MEVSLTGLSFLKRPLRRGNRALTCPYTLPALRTSKQPAPATFRPRATLPPPALWYSVMLHNRR